MRMPASLIHDHMYIDLCANMSNMKISEFSDGSHGAADRLTDHLHTCIAGVLDIRMELVLAHRNLARYPNGGCQLQQACGTRDRHAHAPICI